MGVMQGWATDRFQIEIGFFSQDNIKKEQKTHRKKQFSSRLLLRLSVTQYLRPLPVAAGHVHGGDVLEELLGRDEVRQAGEELGHVDEVHAGQDVLVETQ